MTSRPETTGIMRSLGASLRRVKRPSQIVAYPYFLTAGLLFFLQIIFGLFLAAQYVWPTFMLSFLPFNVNRETHLNLLIIWLLLGLMGAAYYLVVEETDTEIFSVPLAYAQYFVLLVAGLGTLLSFWFLRTTLGTLGKPFTESPYPWPWLIALGVVLFLINLGATLFKAKKWNPITGLLFGGMIGLAGMYLINMVFFPNLVADYYYWWWIIHLWVEGAWELIAAAVMAFLLVKLTGVPRQKLYRWLYVEAALVLFTGILGTGHHYYWIGTPGYWLTIGAVFSALGPVPILIMTIDALMDMRHRSAEPFNKVAWYFVGGSAILHFFGAGVYGFAQTLPQINKWTHGTQITASHGHFAFFGAFGMLVLGALYYMTPHLRGFQAIQARRGMVGFWLMVSGILSMILAFTIAGIVQVYLWRIVGIDFMTVRTQYVSFWIFFVWLFGLTLFLPGATLYLLGFFGMKEEPEAERVAVST